LQQSFSRQQAISWPLFFSQVMVGGLSDGSLFATKA
jgi:hypothetical protein